MRYLKLIVIIVFGSANGWARTTLKTMPLLIMPISDEHQLNNISDEILPKSLTAADTSLTVVSKIIDNSLAYWWRNSELRNTSIGRAATVVEKKMKAEFDLGTTGYAAADDSASGYSAANKAKTDHKLSFKILAMQALAKLEYTGWVAAAINYDAKAARAEAEVIENLANNKDLIISHSITANENKSQLSLRWNW